MASHRVSEDQQSDDHFPGTAELVGAVDLTTFDQILEMDDDDDREFSRGIVFGFFEQAETTFEKMKASLGKGDLATLSGLGHFLKGSSATLGLFKVKDSCEKIQHWGVHRDETGASQPDDAICLNHIKNILTTVKVDYLEAETKLRAFYGSSPRRSDETRGQD